MNYYPLKYKFHNWWYFIIFYTLLVYAVGIPVTIMEPDAASYADASMEMVQRNNYHEIYLKGQDWLDKPHFQFWITALSYKIFGINNFGYKFPAILFSLLAVVYTFLFGKRFYSIKHGAIAALMLMTAEHFILSNNDVRAEPYLTGLTIFSMYYFALYLDRKKISDLVLGSAGLGFLLMTKGLFTIIPVAAGIGLTLIYERKWKEIIHWQWIAAILLTLLFTLPTLISYYIQFDMHPEKEIFGRTGVSGIRFFLWDSQWGRFTNTGPIKGQGDPLFFVHTMLWAFAPWAFLGFWGIFVKTRGLVRKTVRTEKYTFFGFIFLFLVFSVSKFQLPHYLNQIFPFLAILSTHSLVSWSKHRRFLKINFILQVVTIILFTGLLITLHYFFFGNIPKTDVFFIVLMSLALSMYLLINEKTLIKKILIPPAIIILMVNFYLNRQFYPSLLIYQSESEVAFHIKENNLPSEKLIFLGEDQWITEFYLKRVIPAYSFENMDNIPMTGKLVYTNPEGLKRIHNAGKKFEILKNFPDFHVTTLNGTFLNRHTRSQELKDKVLIRIK